jgi:ABC-type sugar transport system ATPase subunit
MPTSSSSTSPPGIDVGAKEEVYRLMIDLAAAGKA